ncbi:MAG: phosphate ABC transporter ATP-binding protein, partial [Actinobacteria bacterium]|nr:phosphate ABC transporter ATP-binding protein [Actinomycetota bacterium]
MESLNPISSNSFGADVHLSTKDVHVWFGQRHVLEGVNLEFPVNSVTALIGPSGCG